MAAFNRMRSLCDCSFLIELGNLIGLNITICTISTAEFLNNSTVKFSSRKIHLWIRLLSTECSTSSFKIFPPSCSNSKFETARSSKERFGKRCSAKVKVNLRKIYYSFLRVTVPPPVWIRDNCRDIKGGDCFP